MRLTLLAAAGILTASYASVCAENLRVTGSVIDADGKPVQDAHVAAFWRANGSGRKPDGTPYDRTDKMQLAELWGHLGDMQPDATRHSITDSDGQYDVEVFGGHRAILAMDAMRRHGGIALLPLDYSGEAVQIRLVPLVTVYGQMKSVVNERPVDWSHVYVKLPHDPQQPLANDRLISCGSFESRFEFRLPPGRYVLHAYASSDSESDSLDLKVQPNPTLTIDAAQPDIDLSVLELTLAPPGINALEALAKAEGRWHDYTQHYGETAPNWHAVDARGIGPKVNINDFHGKWLLVDFWGPSCVPCLETGLPGLMDFYEKHADQRDRFEIVSVCIDYTGKLKNMHDLEAFMAPIETNVWSGRKITFPIVLDNTFTTWERFGIPGLGTVVLVDPDGNLVDGDEATLAQILQNPPDERGTSDP